MRFKIEQVRFDQVDAWGKEFEVYLCGDRKQQFGGIEYGTLSYNPGSESWGLVCENPLTWFMINGCLMCKIYRGSLSEVTTSISNWLIGQEIEY